LHTDFHNTGLLPASAKLAVKYCPGRWNTGHLATLVVLEYYRHQQAENWGGLVLVLTVTNQNTNT